jgi:RNA polymerase sigma-70 factor (ECF subfamily)
VFRPYPVVMGMTGALMETDEDLLEQVAAGDRADALPGLYDRYERRLYGLGLRLLPDRGLAEELVQETFVRLWRSAAQFDPARGSAETFVFTIARRIAADLWRRRSSRPIEPEPDAGRVDPPNGVDTLVVELTVREALDTLPEAQRQVLELAYQHGLSQAEIAERIGAPLGTVKTRTYHALRAMKSALEERDFHE